MSIRRAKLFVAVTGVLLAGSAAATTYSDNFTGVSAKLNWTALNDACLTAGNGSGTIPACPTGFGNAFNNSGVADIPGQGALILTPAQNSQTGAILSAFPPFPLSQGIQITFTTYTYGGDSGGLAHNGADGIVFFLTDGTKAAPTTTGAEGGSMGYDCSNGNGKYDGITNGYLGLGIDEFGNFLNTGDNGTNPQLTGTSGSGVNGGIYNSNDPLGATANGTNTYYSANKGKISAGTGPQYQPERIGLRGAGNTNWAWLQSMNPTYYAGGSNAGKVQTACRRGQYATDASGTTWANIPYNYNAIPGGYAVLPDSQPIANNSKSATRNPTGTTPPANVAWPITYKLAISPGGLLNFSYSYNNGDFQPVLANQDITAFNGPLPSSLRFGFSAGTGGSNNVHAIVCFLASPFLSNTSAGSNTVTGKVTANTQFFLASYSSDNWWGSLVADPLVIQSDGSLAVSTTANWDAKCVLTGGPCDSMGVDSAGNPITTIPVQAPSARNLYTWDGSGAGTLFAWSSLSAAAQTALNKNPAGTVDNQGQQRVQWMQGVRSVEQLQPPPPGTLRARSYVFGDVINASPTFVGAPTVGLYPDTFQDLLYPAATMPENGGSAQAFSAYATSNATRVNVVYSGANDGFMHGFQAGAYTSSGTYNTALNNGKELMAYMPSDVLLNKAVNLADPLYKHDYLVDATPVASDLFYGNKWHTWLVGGVGSSGQEIYALDVTNPTAFAASNVVGDWDNSTLTHLGATTGTPIIARMHNGQWAIIFGSGRHTNNDGSVNNSTTAGVYIGLVNSLTGTVSYQFLDTGVGSSASPDSLTDVTSVDLDGDGIADYLYAGDTQGNVWRFDVTGSLTTNWKLSSFTGAPGPLFVANNAAGTAQPITTAITVLAVQTGTSTRAMVYFGTGNQTQASAVKGVQYATGTSSASPSTAQTFYGIWDWNMNAWNAIANSTAQYAALSAGGAFTRSNLLTQTLVPPPVPTDTTHRYLSSTSVICWKGDAATSACPSGNQFGWLFDLPDPGTKTGQFAGQGEQVIYNATFISGAIVVNTTIPPRVSAAQCNSGTQTGFTMAFNPANGGGFSQGYFPDASGGFSGGSSTVAGVQLNGVGTPTSVQYGGKSYIVTQTVGGTAAILPTNPPANNNPSRVSWRELVNP